jgi:beta-alanine degradation protein BauB
MRLDPGRRQPWHQHLLPYLIVPLTDGKNVMTFDDGRVRETNDAHRAGGVRRQKLPSSHKTCM